MSNPTRTSIDTDAARRGIDDLLAVANNETLARLRDLKEQIGSLEAGRPWGGDASGDAFQKRYATAPDSREVAMDLVNRLKELADHLDSGWRGSINDDEFTRELLTSVPVVDIPNLRF
ncbi:hypothetical protein GCM10027280_57070 [Micromonospora polyrhachis]|uniref:Uncharacterized protein n=1 Tax=Micromonospora polyrhachis TaxID=1282883 RepID=A0A7W7WQP4_9ACTN|nr:hypothetical protein [Micromonospora polyrhachis]MBB4960230.1 hypothetical protein [Micromonospora polyrhachis]